VDLLVDYVASNLTLRHLPVWQRGAAITTRLRLPYWVVRSSLHFPGSQLARVFFHGSGQAYPFHRKRLRDAWADTLQFMLMSGSSLMSRNAEGWGVDDGFLFAGRILAVTWQMSLAC